MADVEFSHTMGGYGGDTARHSADAPITQTLTTLTHIAGAVISLALIAGVGVWGYKLMVRDVSGIPIVRAAEGEMRVRPDDPGGQLAEHQGLAVNEIAARGLASGPVDQVTLATPAVALSEEDQPVAAPAVAPEPVAPAELIAVATEPTAVEPEVTSQQDTIDELVAELVADTEPRVAIDGPKVMSAEAVSTGSELEATQAVLTVEPEAEPALSGLQQSMRPKLRPAVIQPVAYTPAAETAEIDPTAIPSGTRLAQLGAFDSPDVARTEWDRLQQRFGAIMGDKSRVIEQAQSGGRTFYRLRAMGFVDLSDARRFCSAIKAEGADCIPVQVR